MLPAFRGVDAKGIPFDRDDLRSRGEPAPTTAYNGKIVSVCVSTDVRICRSLPS